MKSNLIDIYIVGTAVCLLYFLLMVYFVYAYNKAKRKLKNEALLMVNLFEEEINQLNILLQQEQQVLTDLNDYYLVRMAGLIQFAEQNQSVDLSNNPDWQHQIQEIYELLQTNLIEAKQAIKANKEREDKLMTKINIIKTQTKLIKVP